MYGGRGATKRGRILRRFFVFNYERFREAAQTHVVIRRLLPRVHSKREVVKAITRTLNESEDRPEERTEVGGLN